MCGGRPAHLTKIAGGVLHFDKRKGEFFTKGVNFRLVFLLLRVFAFFIKLGVLIFWSCGTKNREKVKKIQQIRLYRGRKTNLSKELREGKRRKNRKEESQFLFGSRQTQPCPLLMLGSAKLQFPIDFAIILFS